MPSRAIRSTGNYCRMEDEIHVLLYPELGRLTGWEYHKAQSWVHALKVEEGWPKFQRVSVEQGGRGQASYAVPLAKFVYICSRLPCFYPRCNECIETQLEQLVTKLEGDLALLQDFKKRPWTYFGQRKLAHPPIDLDEEETSEETEEANNVLADTAALSSFLKFFTFQGVTFSTLVGSNGAVWIRAKEVVKALGHKFISTTVTNNVDTDRHCLFEVLLARAEFNGVDFKSTLQNLPKKERETLWLSEAGCYELLLKSRLPVAKQLEKWITDEILPALRRTGQHSSLPGESLKEETDAAICEKRTLEETLLQAQIENSHEDLIAKRIANKRARLSLALEAHEAAQVFGNETKSDVIDSGREFLRLACIPAERSDTQTSAREFLHTKGLSEEQISHLQCVFGKIVKRCYEDVNNISPQVEVEIGDNCGKKFQRPVYIYDKRIDRCLFDRSYHLLSLTEPYRKWVRGEKQITDEELAKLCLIYAEDGETEL